MNSTTASQNEMTTGRAYLLVALVATALVALIIVGAGVLLGSAGGPAFGTCPQGQVKVGSALGAPECTYQT
jgi:hypothetical protein